MAATAPRLGDIVEGYRFRGGDPYAEAAWEWVGDEQRRDPEKGEIWDGYVFKGGDPKSEASWTPATERTWGEAATDLGASFGKGAGALVEGAGTLYGLATGDMDNAARRLGGSVSEYWQGEKSAGLVERERQRAESVAAAEGEWGKFGTALKETVTDPALLTSFLAEQVPMTVGPGAVGRAGTAVAAARGAAQAAAARVGTGAAVGAGATLQGSDVGGDTYDEALKLARAKGMSEDEAKGEALMAARQAAAAAGAISVGTQFLPGGRAVERALAGSAERMGSRVAGAVKGGIGETVQEVAEEVGGKVGSNLSLRGVDPERPIMQGTGETAAMAAIGGGTMGATFGALEPGQPAAPKTKTPGEVAADVMAADSVDAAIVAAAEGALAGDTPGAVASPVEKVGDAPLSEQEIAAVQQMEAEAQTLPTETQRALDRPMAFPGLVEGAQAPAATQGAPAAPASNEIPYDRPAAAAMLDEARGIPKARDELAAELQREPAPVSPPAIATPGPQPRPDAGVTVPGRATTEQQYGDALVKQQRGETLSSYEAALLKSPPKGKSIVVGGKDYGSVGQMTDKELHAVGKQTRNEETRSAVQAEQEKRATGGSPLMASVAPTTTKETENAVRLEEGDEANQGAAGRGGSREAAPAAPGAGPRGGGEQGVEAKLPPAVGRYAAERDGSKWKVVDTDTDTAVRSGIATEMAARTMASMKNGGNAEARPPQREPQPAQAGGKPQGTLAASVAQEPNDYSSSQVKMPEAVSRRAMSAAKTLIAPEDVAEKGLEDRPHITVKYGLHTENAEELRAALAGEGATSAKFGPIKVFEPEGKDYDVVVQSVESPGLHKLNAKVGDKLEHTNTFPTYQPHMTLGYVKKGTGKKYAKLKSGLEGQEIPVNEVEFSSRDEKVTPIKLGEKRKPSEPLASMAPVEYDRDENRDTGPLAEYVSEEEIQGRLRRRINRESGVGAPKTGRTVFRNGKERYVLMPTNAQWLARVMDTLSEQELRDSRGWYTQLHDTLVPIYGHEQASRVALAWLLSQQNESPVGGLRNVLRAEDMVSGRPKIKQAGLNEKNLLRALKGEAIQGGVGLKLHDFVDSEMNLESRTAYGGDRRARQPAAMDIWAARDVGYLDDATINWLNKTFPGHGETLQRDFTGGLSETQYEWGLDRYNDIADWLNKKNFMGGKWRAHEVQAVGWITMQKVMGQKPEFVADIVGGNTYRVSLGLAAGTGSPLAMSETGEITPENALAAINDIADIVGAKVLAANPGVGAYLTYVEGAVQIDALTSPETVRDFMDALGYAFQQTEIISTRALASGKNHSVDLFADEFATLDDSRRFFESFLAEVGKTKEGDPIAPGFQQAKVDGKPVLRLLNFAGHWTERQLLDIMGAANAAAGATGINITDGVATNVVFQSTKNDWTQHPDGRAYLDSLRERGRLRQAEALGRRYAPQAVVLADHQSDVKPGDRLQPTPDPDTATQKEGVTQAGLQGLVDRAREEWAELPPTVAVQSIEDLPGHVRERLGPLAKRKDPYKPTRLEGLYDPDDGTIYLIADGIRDMERAEFVLAHEALGHAGLRKLFGDKLDAVLRSLYEGNASIRVAADKMRADRTENLSIEKAVEEVLADMAGDGRAKELKGWDKLVKLFREFMLMLGLKRSWSDETIERIVAAAGATIKHGGGAAPRARDERMAASEPAPMWYSELARQISATKNESMPAPQWRAYIKNLTTKGVKADEIRWSSIEEFLQMKSPTFAVERDGEVVNGILGGLFSNRAEADRARNFYANTRTDTNKDLSAVYTVKERPAGKVTKDEILTYLRNNGVRVDEKEFRRREERALNPEERDVIEGQIRAAYARLDMLHGLEEKAGDDLDDALMRLNGAGWSQEYKYLQEHWQRPWEKMSDEDKDTIIRVFATNNGLDVEMMRKAHKHLYDVERATKIEALAEEAGEKKEAYENAARRANAARENIHDLNMQLNGMVSAKDNTKFSGYQAIRGLKNYREVLLTLPPGISAQSFTESHWESPNVLAHFRAGEARGADGKRILVLNEAQTDWGQQGREFGFRLAPDEEARFRSLDKKKMEEMTEAEQIEYDKLLQRREGLSESAVPAAPYVQKTEAWTALVLKRLIRMAIDEGFDQVAWATGKQQVDLYGGRLRESVDRIEWEKTPEGVHLKGIKGGGSDRQRIARQRVRDEMAFIDRQMEQLIGDRAIRELSTPEAVELADLRAKRVELHDELLQMPEGNEVVNTRYAENQLTAAIGKAMADRIREDTNQKGVIEGDNITIDDTGMGMYYDQILPNVANDVLKKLGGDRVKKIAIRNAGGLPVMSSDEDGMPNLTIPKTEQLGFDITPEMRAKVAGGMPLFSTKPDIKPSSDVLDLVRGLELAAEQAAKNRKADRGAKTARMGRPLQLMEAIAADPESFQFGTSDSRDWNQIIKDMDLDQIVEVRKPADSLERALGEMVIVTKSMKPVVSGTTPRHRNAYVSFAFDKLAEWQDDGEATDKVWLNIAEMRRGSGGKQAYQLVSTWAANNGFVFVPDPLGVSPSAVEARVSNGLSAAMRLGTTKYMLPPSPGDLGLSYPEVPTPKFLQPLAGNWKIPDEIGDEADQHNKKLLIEAQISIVEEKLKKAKVLDDDGLIIDDLSNIEYNFDSEQIVYGDSGEPVSQAVLDRLAEALIPPIHEVSRSRGEGAGRGGDLPVGEGSGSAGDTQAGAPSPRGARATLVRAAVLKSALELSPAHVERLSARLHRGEHPAAGTPRQSLLASVAPDWVRSGSKDLQSAASKIDTYAPAQPLTAKLRELQGVWKDRLIQKLFDAYAPLKKLSPKAYVLARMARSSDTSLEATLLYGKPKIASEGYIYGDIDKKGFLGHLQDLQGEHDRFLMWVAGNRAERLAGEDRENLFSADEIRAMKALINGKMPDGSSRPQAYARAAEQMRQYNKSILDIAEKTGLIDGESRKLWEHDYYVPFFRVSPDDDAKIEGPSKIKGLLRQKAFEKLKGGEENLGDLLDNVLSNWSHLLGASLANQAAVTSLKAAEKAGVAKRLTAQDIAMGNTGNAYAMEDGKKVHYEVEDAFVLEALSAMESASYKGLPMELMGKAKHYLTLGVTASPTFRIRNLMRDSISAVAQNDVSYNVAKNLYQGFKGAKRSGDTYMQAMFNGALIRFGQTTDGKHASHAKRLIMSGVKDQTILDTKTKVADALQKVWDEYQEFGDKMENVNRLARYQQGLAKGESPLDAAFASRDMLDFSLQGSHTAVRALTQVVPFMNARLQGMYKLGRSGSNAPARFFAVTGMAALVSIGLFLKYRDDDDWKKRADWDRDNFWWFKVGGTAYRIPKPFEVGALATLAERSVELVMSDEMTGKRFGERVLDMLGDTLALNPLPQLFKPAMELYFDRDFFSGREIESRRLEGLSKPERMTSQTSIVAKLLGKAGDTTKLSPVQIDHLIRGYFGWLGAHIVMVGDVVAEPFLSNPKPARRVQDIFVAGDFAESVPSSRSRYIEEFYKQSKAVHEVMGDIKRAREVGDLAKVTQILADRGDRAELATVYQRAERTMGEINRQIRVVEGMKDVPAEAKRQRIDELRQQQHLLTKGIETLRLERRKARAAAPAGR